MRIGDAQTSFIQVLPDSAPAKEGLTTLQAINLALKTGLPEDGQKVRATNKHLQLYRLETKKCLRGVHNALSLMVPQYDFSKSVLHRRPRPRAKNEERFALTDDEKSFFNLPTERDFFFLCDSSEGVSVLDHGDYTSPPLRLVWASDEGTEMFQTWPHLCEHGVLAVMFPDTAHKLHRKQANVLAAVPQAKSLLHKLTRVFRSTRGPWHSNRFGRARLESRSRMLLALEELPDSPFLEGCLPGLAGDRGEPASLMTNARAVSLLKAASGSALASGVFPSVSVR